MTLVVTGASLGAKTVNDAIVRVASGPDRFTWGGSCFTWPAETTPRTSRAAYSAVPSLRVRVVDFTPGMADVWAVCRPVSEPQRGQQLRELIAAAVPSILMPYPYHKDMHQRANAQVLADAGAAVLLDDLKDVEVNASRLKPVLNDLTSNATRRDQMADAARGLQRGDAAAQAAAVVTALANG